MSTTHLWALVQEWRDAQFFRVSQAQLAEKVGVTRSAVSQWKSGQARPGPEHLLALHRVTRIDYDSLVEAVVQDMGYRSDREVGEERAGSASMNQGVWDATADHIEGLSSGERSEAPTRGRQSDERE